MPPSAAGTDLFEATAAALIAFAPEGHTVDDGDGDDVPLLDFIDHARENVAPIQANDREGEPVLRL